MARYEPWMDAGETANAIGDQFVTVAHAPVPFIAALIPLTIAIWWLVHREFRTRLANSESTSKMYKDRLDRLEAGDALSIAMASRTPETATPDKSPATGPSQTRNTPLRPPPAGPKVYIGDEKTPADLVAVFDERTDLQGRKMLEPQFGKWMRVEGTVRGVNEDALDAVVALHIADARFIFSYFACGTAGLERLNIGDKVRLEGQILDIDRLGITLKHCSFLN